MNTLLFNNDEIYYLSQTSFANGILGDAPFLLTVILAAFAACLSASDTSVPATSPAIK